MLTSVIPLLLALGASTLPVTPGDVPQIEVRVDSARREITLTARGISIPAGMAYGHHALESAVRFQWPVDGWVHGYRIDVVDSSGRAMPRTSFHHGGVANLDRRQLAYPIAERLFAAGRETRPVMLPSSMGVPISTREHLLFYYALVNPGATPIENATVRLTVAWIPATSRPRTVLPVFFDANPSTGIRRSFDLPPGRSTTRAEFTLPVGGRLRGLGAHVHDHATEIRLEDVESGKVLARLSTKRRDDGSLISVAQTKFLLKRGGLRLHAGRTYRVVSEYDNPTCATITDGAMAFLAGPFVPDDMSTWPVLDRTDERFAADYAQLLGGTAAEHESHEGEAHTGHGDHGPAAGCK
jgi:hypothetical protein